MRNILLIEPNYKNKYPPIGLMKLSTYHKELGDNVVFYKGESKDFPLKRIVTHCIEKLKKIDNSINWHTKFQVIEEFIKKGKTNSKDDLKVSGTKYEILINQALNYYRSYYRKKEYLKEQYWDRVYITTLFTFYWDITIETINFFKQFVKSENDLWVGGVMASVIPEEIIKETGIKNVHAGLLDKPGVIDDNNIIIDNLRLDYSILDEIDYKYPENNAYYGYTTRGCVRKCDFCAVPKIEPRYVKHVPLTDKIKGVNEIFGYKRNLLLLDNNVLASTKFSDIIQEILDNGFDKKTKFTEPNQLDISVRNLNAGINDNAYIRKIVSIFNEAINFLKGEHKQFIYNKLYDLELLKIETATKENINKFYPTIQPLYEKYRNKVKKSRYVDFNQGVDARLLTDKKAKLLSLIPIKPLRIAFDSIDFESDYVSAVMNAKKYGIDQFSNYLLYNHNDKPIELYLRLKLNVELCERHDLDIYSFPMKYHPIFGDGHLNRDYLGKYWNRKYIRTIQIILNATKGKVGKSKSFFLRAFGNDINEFEELLYMPEDYIYYRIYAEESGITKKWLLLYRKLIKDNKYSNLFKFIELSNFRIESEFDSDPIAAKFLWHYKNRLELESINKWKLQKAKNLIT